MPGGSGVRDYIHVMDLAEGHRAALHTLLAETPQLLTLNLGSGQCHSVPYEMAGRGSAPIPLAT